MAVISIEHRGVKALAVGDHMTIRNYSGVILARDDHWSGARLGDDKSKAAKLRRDVDDYVRLAPFFGGESWR